MNLLAPYLPQEGAQGGSEYSEGGSLFALGLINANYGKDVLNYLKKALKDTDKEVIQHGAGLGLGVAGMATDSEGIVSWCLALREYSLYPLVLQTSTTN